MSFTNPIMDRSATDITNRTAKAFFNVADWVRIYNNAQAAQALIQALNEISISFTTVSAPTTLSMAQAAAINTLCQNIENIRAGSGLPAIPGIAELETAWATGQRATSPNYITVNQWEETIETLRTGIIGAVEYRIYCGVAEPGQSRFRQNLFRRFQWVEPLVSWTRQARAGVPGSTTGSSLMRQNSFRRY